MASANNLHANDNHSYDLYKNSDNYYIVGHANIHMNIYFE